ncbi:hypothetical protein Atc_0774 [Acidithiobacillus caldus SM-1]|uniref:Uncharacterized protein n=1 Tax=Acidithiobacillus caldus (strain SM-1) TaxID=990288 RepID=F9ZLU1_ACICS|nr:hypothetical protein Atc_0774 [Acidithiobacillus caldus SM-1]
MLMSDLFTGFCPALMGYPRTKSSSADRRFPPPLLSGFLRAGSTCPSIKPSSLQFGKRSRRNPALTSLSMPYGVVVGKDPIVLLPCHQCPDSAGHTRRQGDHRLVLTPTLHNGTDPSGSTVFLGPQVMNDRGSALYQESAQINIPALGNPQESGFPARTFLLGNQADPSGELSPIFENPSIINRGDHGGRGHGSDTWYGHKALNLCIGFGEFGYLLIILSKPIGQLPALIEQVSEQIAGNGRKRFQVYGMLQRLSQLCGPLRNHHAEFCQQTADLVTQGGQMEFGELLGAMQRQHRLLLGTFDGHETHSGSAGGFTDGLGIVGIVFADLSIWRDKLRGYEAYFMTRGLEEARPVMGPAAALHGNLARGELRKKLHQLISPQGVTQHHLAVSIHATQLKDILCQINS